jgi:hypothetical protein
MIDRRLIAQRVNCSRWLPLRFADLPRELALAALVAGDEHSNNATRKKARTPMPNATSSSTPSPLERLSTLATQRTARTDQLHEAALILLGRLEQRCAVGDCAVVDGCELSLVRKHSNVGYTDFWMFTNSRDYCLLDCSLESERYLHGDFNVLLRGPSRSDLLEFAKRATRFVEKLVQNLETEVADLTTANGIVKSAVESM